jgi:hypothetical protein
MSVTAQLADGVKRSFLALSGVVRGAADQPGRALVSGARTTRAQLIVLAPGQGSQGARRHQPVRAAPGSLPRARRPTGQHEVPSKPGPRAPGRRPRRGGRSCRPCASREIADDEVLPGHYCTIVRIIRADQGPGVPSCRSSARVTTVRSCSPSPESTTCCHSSARHSSTASLPWPAACRARRTSLSASDKAN